MANGLDTLCLDCLKVLPIELLNLLLLITY